MMAKGKYDDNLLVPYDRTSIAINYSNDIVVVESVQFQVFRKYDAGEYKYDWTGCFDVNGDLKCREERGKFTSDKVTDEVLLTKSFDIFSTINTSSIISEIRNNYNVIPKENTLIIAHLVLPTDIEEKTEKFENIIFYLDGEYLYDSTYEPSEMMLEVRITISGNGEGETYIVYFEID